METSHKCGLHADIRRQTNRLYMSLQRKTNVACFILCETSLSPLPVWLCIMFYFYPLSQCNPCYLLWLSRVFTPFISETRFPLPPSSFKFAQSHSKIHITETHHHKVSCWLALVITDCNRYKTVLCKCMRFNLVVNELEWHLNECLAYKSLECHLN